jgi:cobyrinic acid a,c-diamide synthase
VGESHHTHAGVIFNKVGGAAHAAWLEEALTAAGLAARVLGGVPKVGWRGGAAGA